MKNAVLTGGGTGGHLFAALSFASYLKNNGYNPIFIGSIYGLESDILKRYEFEYYLLNSRGVMGKNLKEKIIGSAFSMVAFFKAVNLIRRINPEFCVGFGGYVSLPVMLASIVLGKKTAVLEQNSIPGKANKLLSRIVDITFVNFPTTKLYLKNSIVVGNPIRIKFGNPKTTFGEVLTIGVLGGSRGARKINEAMVDLSGYDLSVKVIHQTGKEDVEKVKRAYVKNGKDWIAVEFIEDIEKFYKTVDFVICRAGASTLSEIACSGLGSLIVPYPYAIYDHQYYNAKYFYDNGAAQLIEDKELTGKKLYSFISSLAVEKLKEMSKNAFRLCRRDPCEKMLESIKVVKK